MTASALLGAIAFAVFVPIAYVLWRSAFRAASRAVVIRRDSHSQQAGWWPWYSGLHNSYNQLRKEGLGFVEQSRFVEVMELLERQTLEAARGYEALLDTRFLPAAREYFLYAMWGRRPIDHLDAARTEAYNVTGTPPSQ